MSYFDDFKRLTGQNEMPRLEAAEKAIGKGENGYIAFYKDKRYEVHGDTLMKARDALAAHLKLPPKKHADINIKLAQKGGKDVVHTPTEARMSEAHLIEASLEDLFVVLAECLEAVAEEEGYSEIDVARTYLRVVENDAYFNAMLAECAGSLHESAELSELLRQSSGGSSGAALGGRSFKNDPTRASYAKAFSKQAVADAERRGAEKDAKKLSPSELKQIRSAAAKKAWETRKGKMKGALSKLGKGAMNVVQKVKSFASKALSGKSGMAAQPA